MGVILQQHNWILARPHYLNKISSKNQFSTSLSMRSLAQNLFGLKGKGVLRTGLLILTIPVKLIQNLAFAKYIL